MGEVSELEVRVGEALARLDRLEAQVSRLLTERGSSRLDPRPLVRRAYAALRGRGPLSPAALRALAGIPQSSWQAVRPLLLQRPGVRALGSRRSSRLERVEVSDG